MPHVYLILHAFNHPSTSFFFNDTATTEIYTLSLHDALPISQTAPLCSLRTTAAKPDGPSGRSEEHTSELQSPVHLVCRLLLEKKKSRLLRCRTTMNVAVLRGVISPLEVCY